MPDYIYLLENRLSPAQQNALKQVREVAREAGMTVFLTGGAVRDLTSGSPVRDLDFSVQGNALHLKKSLKEAGGTLWGEHASSQTLFFRFPGSVRTEVSSTRREDFPKPGKVVYHPATILEDLRRRDFTANAMALSLNEGSYGLLMDPMNGVADLEARALRLVSNYGFLEEPIRLVRAARLAARLGWELEERTKARFQNAREEGVISQISAYQLGYEVEEIVHEEDGLRILKALEADGWMKHLYPAWTSAKADTTGLDEMRDVLVQLQMQGVNPDASAAQAELLTAKMSPKDLAGLKALIVRKGFVHEWESLEQRGKEFAKRLTGKESAAPSATWRLFTNADPEAILWLGLTGKSAPVQAKYSDFFSVWPEARQRIPYALMQEMRITPEIEGYQDLLREIFLQLIDGKLTTDEEMRAFLVPYSPPAPPPPVSIRRTRGKKAARIKEVEEEVHEHAEEDEEHEDDTGGAGRHDEDRHEEPVVAARLIETELPRPAPAPPVAGPVAQQPPAKKQAPPQAVAKKSAQPIKLESKRPAPPVKPEAKKVVATPKPPAKSAPKHAAKSSAPQPKAARKTPSKAASITKAVSKPKPKLKSKPAVKKSSAKKSGTSAADKGKAHRVSSASKSVKPNASKPATQSKGKAKPAPKSSRKTGR